MPSRTIKVAVSLPADTYRKIEKTRKQRRISRSAVISEALRCWVASGQEQEKVHAYVEGYRRAPETVQEFKPFELLTYEALAAEEWKA